MSTPPRPSLFTPLIDKSPDSVPFTGPETIERRRGRPFAARLGANENGFGPSEAVVEALGRAAAESWMYGDPEGFELRSAIAERISRGERRIAGPENIALGEGIDGLLGLACRLTLSPGDPAVISLGGYPTFGFHVAGCGGRLERVPYAEDRSALTALAARAHESGARLLYLSNPDNPMGGRWSAGAIAAWIDAAPETCLILLDEAYVELAPKDAAPPLDLERPNLLRLRTFSKAYGLAGLRVGYAVGAPQTVKAFDKIRNHFGVGRLAQAGALAALRDEEGLDLSIRRIAESRERLAGIAEANGLTPLPSATNFVAMDCGRDGDFARALQARLEALDVFTRVPGVAPLDRCIRISCGPEREMAIFEQALAAALAELR